MLRRGHLARSESLPSRPEKSIYKVFNACRLVSSGFFGLNFNSCEIPSGIPVC